MDFPLADLLFKRARLNGQHPISTVTITNNQDTDTGNVGQSNMTHNPGSTMTYDPGSTMTYNPESTMTHTAGDNHKAGLNIIARKPGLSSTNVRSPRGRLIDH